MTDLLFVPGSLRAKSSSRATMRALIRRIEGDATCHVADPGALPHYNADVSDDAQVARFIDQISGADGIVFVTPEYNYSIPGLLKNAIDWASRPAYASVFKDKPCFIVTTSGGVLGGARAQAHLKYVLNGMLAKVFVCKEIIVPFANDKVTDGFLSDETILEFAEEQLRAFIADMCS